MDTILHIQGNRHSKLTPLILIHAVSGLALPYYALGNLSSDKHDEQNSRPVFGISSPVFASRTYQLPSSLSEIAQQYVRLVRQEIQPTGPYLLGGWSMGGMIAIKMAEILQKQGQVVQHVLLIDSYNPEQYPAFRDEEEHQIIADGLYRRVWEKIPGASDDSADSTESEDTEDDSEESEDNKQLHQLFSVMRYHIWQSLRTITQTEPGELLQGTKCHTRVTLVKCTKMASAAPALYPSREKIIRKGFFHPTLRWRLRDFDRFRTVLFDAVHDDVFDADNVVVLTKIMRRILMEHSN